MGWLLARRRPLRRDQAGNRSATAAASSAAQASAIAATLPISVPQQPPRIEVDFDALADHLTVIVQGAIVLSKALNDPELMGRQTRLFRNHVKLIFGVK